MRKFKKFTGILLAAIMIFTSFTTFSFATFGADTDSADQPPVAEDNEKPGKLDLSASYELEGELSAVTANFKWDAVAGALSYSVSVKLNGVEKARADATETAASVSGLDLNNTYTYAVTAYDGSGSAIGTSKEFPIDKVQINKPVLTEVSYSYADMNQDNIKIKWKNPEIVSPGASYTIVYGSSLKGVSNVLVDSVSTESTSYSKKMSAALTNTLTTGDKYYFKLRVNVSDAGKVYAETEAFAKTGKIYKNYDWYARAKKNIAVYKSSKGSSKLTSMKLGEEALAIGKYPKKVVGWNVPSRVNVKLQNGKKGWVSWGSVKMVSKVKDHDVYDYTTAAKENFVKEYSSKTGTLIWVNRYTQHCYIFKGKKGKWKLYKTYKCTTANFYQPTYGGVKKITNHKYKGIKTHKTGRQYYFMYSTGYHGSGTMHTRCKWLDNNAYRNSIKKTPSTKGCVRLPDDAAKYVYKLGIGTTVVIK